MKLLRVLPVVLCIVYSSAKGDLLEFDGSGDIISPSRPPKTKVIELGPASVQHIRARDKTVKRTMRVLLPGMIRSFLDTNLSDFIQKHMANIVEARPAQDLQTKVQRLERVVTRLKARLANVGNRMRLMERHFEDHLERHDSTMPPRSTEPARTSGFDSSGELQIIDPGDVVLLETVRNQTEPNDASAGKHGLRKTSPISKTKRDPKSCQSKTTDGKHEHRVLAVSYKDSKFVIFGKNDEQIFPLQTSQVRSVVYDPATESVIWSNYTSRDPGIFSSSLKTPAKSTKLSRLSSEGMAIDVCKRLLFFTTSTPRYTISKMTTRGRHLREVKHMKKYGPYMYSLAVDPDAKVIYTCHYSFLVKTSYDGRRQEELIKDSSSIFAVSLDPTNQALYYSSWGGIKRLQLDKGQSETVVEIRTSPRNIVFYQNRLYFDNSNLIKVFGIKSDRMKTLGKLDESTLSICLIP
ncbi:uncharacterized protein LOC124115027 [Haliotis rufescens]|uniref:uncharacterized protein LOC124115027 n=1 Tax=Haliotis rufescens TaxID=6454 RepID=UPI001EB082C2|nr:uncharacterized protein LOC124115027 [Haliotis rufescens]XP_046331785.1 uncharacterized protein LOC124115027 [Haliotis rufescens]XP_046331786.1 uncharacterized protein LOC124115027 [Haliotis rufescens]XP_048243869.1 uncharacterized protein LOC124115027 [Haliotis rufescens]